MNEFKLKLLSKIGNESFARSCISAFCLELNPTLEEISDIKTAVSEAVTNCIVHAYPNGAADDLVTIKTTLENDTVHIVISDTGVGIENIDNALQPFYTSKPEQERSGMGFTVMESFMDTLRVEHNEPRGTVVLMTKTIRGGDWNKKKHCD